MDDLFLAGGCLYGCLKSVKMLSFLGCRCNYQTTGLSWCRWPIQQITRTSERLRRGHGQQLQRGVVFYRLRFYSKLELDSESDGNDDVPELRAEPEGC